MYIPRMRMQFSNAFSTYLLNHIKASTAMRSFSVDFSNKIISCRVELLFLSIEYLVVSFYNQKIYLKSME